MQRDLFFSTMLVVGLAVGTLSAEAKTIGMGAHSRSQVQSACSRAGGTAFGILDETASYGCYGRYAAVNCTLDADCNAVVRDTMPVTGNSLDLILQGPERSGPTTIKPVDSRITPAVTP